MSGSYLPKPKPCIGYLRESKRKWYAVHLIHEKCPHGASVLKRYAVRCKSCAAKQRHTDRRIASCES